MIENTALNDRLGQLLASVKVLKTEVEGWRTHAGSTGYFLLIAVEDLTKAVIELANCVKNEPPRVP